MKIKTEIEIDPKELREFLGLPDVAGLQKEAVKVVMSKMKSGAEGFEPTTLLKQMLPSNLLSKADIPGLVRRVLASAELDEEELEDEEDYDYVEDDD